MISSEQITRILHLISNNELERQYFFNRLGKAKNPFEWFIPLKEKGFLDPSRNPDPIEDKGQNGFYKIPHWEVLDFLLNVATKNKEQPTDDITNELLEFIDNLISYSSNKGKIDNYRTDWILLKIIFLLPFDRITSSHINYISIVLNSRWDNTLIVDVIKEKIIPILIKNHPTSHEYLKMLMNYLWQYKIDHKRGLSDECSSIIPEYWLQEIMDKYRNTIAEKLKEDAVDIAEKKIREILKTDDSHFNLIWIPHLNENSQNKFLDRYEIQLTFFIRDCLIKSNIEILSEKIRNYIKDEHPIFRRLAIYCIDKSYSELKDIFWSINDNPLEYYSVKHELFTLFQNHSKDFSTDEIKFIINWIENKDFSYLDNDEQINKNKENIIYYRKKEWLYPLLSSNNSQIESLYNKYNSLNPTTLDHPGYDFWSDDFTYGGKEIDIPTDLCSRSNEEIVKYFVDKVADNKKLNYAFKDDYVESFKECFKKNPSKFLQDLKPILGMHPLYQYQIIRACVELWREKIELDWGNIFDFVIVVINNIDYENAVEKDEFSYRDWLINAIADLIEDGTRNDKNSFSPEYLPISKKILLSIENRIKSKPNFTLDLATTSLNSTRGRIYSAIVNYALRYARLYKKEEMERFDKDILKLFNTRLLERKEIEFFYALGRYMLNLLFLDRNWLLNNINKIFDMSNETLWNHTMSGYLFFADRVHKDIYEILDKEKHLMKAVNTDFPDKNLNSRLVQHICISFLNKWESLLSNDSLLKVLIEKSEPSRLKEIIHFIWTQREFIEEKSIYEDVLNLLFALYDSILKINDVKTRNELLSDLSKWIVFINKPDKDLKNIFLEVAKYSSLNFHNLEIVDNISEKIKDYPKEFVEILINIIEYDEKYPYYKEESLIKIFDALKDTDSEMEIKKICNKLISKGLYEYRNVLAKYIKSDNANQAQ